MITKKDLAGLGPAIKTLRKKRNLSTEEMAEQVGVSYKHMANIQDGHSTPSLLKYAQICHVLGFNELPMVDFGPR